LLNELEIMQLYMKVLLTFYAFSNQYNVVPSMIYNSMSLLELQNIFLDLFIFFNFKNSFYFLVYLIFLTNYKSLLLQIIECAFNCNY